MVVTEIEPQAFRPGKGPMIGAIRGNDWTPDEQSAIQNAITPAPGEGFLRNFGKQIGRTHV